MFKFFRALTFWLNPFWVQLHYFIIVSLAGYLALKVSKPRSAPSFRPKDLDLFFTSVSAATVSSMSTVEMEVFSNTQLVIVTILMFVGGEVFTSLLGLQLMRFKSTKNDRPENRVDSVKTDSDSPHTAISLNEIQLCSTTSLESGIKFLCSEDLKYNSIKCLGYVVLSYLLLIHVGGSTLISIYISLVPSAREILKNKGLQLHTFSIFTTVSTFANCGFIPTNENMIVVVKNSGLLLLLIPQVLLGNTLYAPCLRFVIWVLERVTKREEFSYMLKNYRKLGYGHLFSTLRCLCLAATVFGFILVQFILFCSMEWNSEGMDGLNSYQKLVASLFQVVNSRHTGESVVDLSIISPSILVLFIAMMLIKQPSRDWLKSLWLAEFEYRYLPSYTSFFPIDDCVEPSTNDKKSTKGRKNIVDYIMFSQLSYLAIFVILICITEREKMKEDPLNFNVLTITLEVVSSYGNVGFSTGYSCKRRMKSDSYCKDAYYGFVGRWSNKGKLILILVMFFGRLKNSYKNGGRAWKLA